MEEHWDAIIIGGGAAGLWAAGTAAARGRRVLLLEKNNKPGPKILMSGGTRCNITHHCDARKIAEAFGANGRALLSPLKRLPPPSVVELFEAEGVATKVEETGKVFPVSDRAIDVRDALVRRLTRHGACLMAGTPVLGLSRCEVEGKGGFQVRTESHTFRAESVLVTTGGLSYAGCGTTGDGYPWLSSLGHTITPLRPALTPLLSPASWVHALSGLTLEDALVEAVVDADPSKSSGGKGHAGKRSIERRQSRGGLLWTHFGCSGPTAMNISRCYDDEAKSPSSPWFMHVDLIPGWSLEQMDRELLQCCAQGGKGVVNLLSQWMPRRLSETVMSIASVPIQIRSSELSKKQRLDLVATSKRLRVPIAGTRGYPKAEVTAGGVELGEVNFQDMQSRICPGLFLAGEILDLDGPIGGFNFQAAWSTGHAAGLHI